MLKVPDRLWMRLDAFVAPESPPEDVFDFFVHVYILSVPLTPLLISPSSRLSVQQDPGHFFFIVEVELKPAAAAVIHRDVSEMGS